MTAVSTASASALVRAVIALTHRIHDLTADPAANPGMLADLREQRRLVTVELVARAERTR